MRGEKRSLIIKYDYDLPSSEHHLVGEVEV